MAGVFIAFEGGEGGGKSTQIALLANWLGTVWPHPITTTREPGGTHGAEAIRQLLVTGEQNWDSTTEALLMTAARRENVTRIIAPALSRGEAVLSDRFFASTLVYQGIAGGMDRRLIDLLNSNFLNGIAPDITIVLDIDPVIGLARAGRADNTETRFEAKGLAYHQAVRDGFLALAQANPDRFITIDASPDEHAVHTAITHALAPRLAR